MKKLAITVVMSFALFISAQAFAQKLSIAYQGDNGVEKPLHGSSMAVVVNKFGQPEKQFEATGNPPITRWVYKTFTVYFESDIVIHSVTNKK